jgi:ribA/ribD-fused uncharacterized protein
MERQLKDFYKRRAKNPDDFGYTSDGNVISKSGEVAMNSYRPPTIAEIEEVEKIRREAIAVAEAAYEDARRELYAAVGEGLNSDNVEILIANKKVADADLALQYARYGERGMSVAYTFPRNKILFEEKYDERIIGAIELPILRGLTMMDQYVRIGEAAAADGSKAANAPGAVAPAAAPSVSVLVFSDPESDLGYLSWAYATEIVIGDTVYTSPYQAVMGELAKYYGDTTGLDDVLNAESPDEIEYGADDVGTSEEDWASEFEEQLGKVMRAKFEQHPVLVEQLLQTGDALLGAAIDGDTLYGIGLPASSAFVKKPNKWTGQNRLGKLLMAIRQEQKIVREQAPVEQPKKRRIKRIAASAGPAAQPMVDAAAMPEVAPAAEIPVVQPVVEAAAMPEVAPAAEMPVVQPVVEAAAMPEVAPAAEMPVAAAVPATQSKKKRTLRMATAPTVEN